MGLTLKHVNLAIELFVMTISLSQEQAYSVRSTAALPHCRTAALPHHFTRSTVDSPSQMTDWGPSSVGIYELVFMRIKA
jgi:hypothetical protein